MNAFRSTLFAAVITAAMGSAMANGTITGCEAYAKGAELAQQERQRGTDEHTLRMVADTAWRTYATAAGLSNYQYEMMRSGAKFGWDYNGLNILMDATENCRNNRV